MIFVQKNLSIRQILELKAVTINKFNYKMTVFFTSCFVLYLSLQVKNKFCCKF